MGLTITEPRLVPTYQLHGPRARRPNSQHAAGNH